MGIRLIKTNFLFAPLDVHRDWPWISQQLHCHLVEDTGGLIAFDGDLKPVAAMVADSFSTTSCCVHIVVRNPMVLRHGFFKLCAEALFDGWKRLVIIGVTPSDNKKALRLNKHLGWREIYRIRDGYKVGVDLVVQEMRREDCRWLQGVL